MQRIRDAVLQDLHHWTTKSDVSPASTAAVYGLLMWMPIDYISRTARAELLRRALAADLAANQDVRSLTALREFLRRTFSHMGGADHAVRVNLSFAILVALHCSLLVMLSSPWASICST